MSDDFTYRGYGNNNPAGGRLVVVELHGHLISVLPHIARHADAFSWGYGGSSPSDLARSILIHALGAAAHCTTCTATGSISAATLNNLNPAAARTRLYPIADIDDAAEPAFACPNCDQGYLVPPAMYLQFKNDVVANLPASGWTLNRTDILCWLARHLTP